MQGGLLLDVVVRQRAPVLQLLAGEDEALLVRGDALLVLDLALHILDGVRGFHLQGNGLAGQCLQRVTSYVSRNPLQLWAGQRSLSWFLEQHTAHVLAETGVNYKHWGQY